MIFRDYIKEKLIFLVVNGLLYMIFSFILYQFHLSIPYLLVVFAAWFIPLIVWFCIDFAKRRKFYQQILEGFTSLDRKYLLQTIIEEPLFLEGKILHHILSQTNRAVHEEINSYKIQQLEYREYMEMWVHEIKTPIAVTKLILDNQGDTSVIYEELTKIEDYIEQVLYYARSTQVSKDYFVRDVPLRMILTKVIKKHAKSFIHKKIKLNLAEFDEMVYSDPKWVEFMINQVIVNAINYSKGEDRHIRIDVRNQENNLVLTIADNGIGIDDKDIPRVFEKGFTGENGRMYGKSTGMGLYLCKMLAEKLYIGLQIESEKYVGTKVHFIFPIGKLTLLETDSY